MKSKKLQFKIKNFYFLVVVLSLTFLVLSFSVADVTEGASLYLSPAVDSYNIGQTFSVTVYVSSTDQAMNAASGVISFPQEKLEVVSLSKSSSIVNLWVQEPVFSNIAGTINFEGIVLNPGFKDSSGKIITVNLKTKAIGSASLTFSSGSVLANDGKGTNILTSMSSGSYIIQTEVITPPIEEFLPPENTPAAPVISSSTHLDSEKWYSNNDPKFTWEVPEDITGVKLLVSHQSVVTPTVFYSEPITEKQLEDLTDGIWYFHVQLQNKFGWGGVSHFKFQIDTVAPLSFEIEIKEGEETTIPQPTLIFGTTDEISRVDYYEVKIDQESPIKTEEKEYKIPVQALGTHTIIIKAVDMAGNSTLAMKEINILAIETPVITDYPKTLHPGEILLIRGTAVPEVKVNLYIKKDAEEPKIEELKSDKEGKWSYIVTEGLEKGIYQFWAEAVDSLGEKSRPSEKITVQVVYSAFVIILLVLIVAIFFGIIWSWWKTKQRKKILRKNTTDAEETLYRAFKFLEKETKKQVANLDGKSDLSEEEKKIYNELKKTLNNSEKIIGKKIKDIEKELE